jgi:hypothetical protein
LPDEDAELDDEEPEEEPDDDEEPEDDFPDEPPLSAMAGDAAKAQIKSAVVATMAVRRFFMVCFL